MVVFGKLLEFDELVKLVALVELVELVELVPVEELEDDVEFPTAIPTTNTDC